jgi:hypothetical protein
MIHPAPSLMDQQAVVQVLLTELRDDHKWHLRLRELRHPCSTLSNTLPGAVLDYGLGRYGARLPREVRKLALGGCYCHATTLMRRDPDRFVYCEGYADYVCDRPIPLCHAWVLDRANGDQVVDNTWPHPIEAVYLGIPFAPEFVRERMRASGYYGVFYPLGVEQRDVLTRPSEDWLHPDAAELTWDFSSRVPIAWRNLLEQETIGQETKV